MITISEVIEEVAKECEVMGRAWAIRTLKQQYEGCIVAEGVSHAYTIVDRMERSSKEEARLAIDGWAPLMIPRYIVVRLYRAKEPTK
jgi:hypothetical protein